MQTLFQNVLTAGLHGSIVILAVLLLRLVLKKVPRKYFCLLWLLAFLRLLMPFEIRFGLSLQPDVETLSRPETTQTQQQPLPDPVPAVPEDAALPPDTEVVYGDAFTPPESIPEGLEGYYPTVEEETQLVIDWNAIGFGIWLAAAGGLVLYSILSFARLKRQVREAVRSGDGVWECAGLETAFILGWLKPRVYLPMGLSPDTRHHILRHERAHLRRRDHWVKLLAFGAVCIHWFNPLVWAAWVLLCRDMELACDEQVVKDMGLAERKDYSAALLRCSSARDRYMVCPVAFGEVSVKTRILSVLNYRRPGFWITLAGVVAIVFVAVFLMTSPKAEEPLRAGYLGPDEPYESYYTTQREQQWEEDILYLAEAMLTKHPRLYNGNTYTFRGLLYEEKEFSNTMFDAKLRQEFIDGIDTLIPQLAQMSDEQIPFEINRVMALAGDENTRLQCERFESEMQLAVEPIWNEENVSFRVVMLPKEYENLILGELTAINGIPTAEIADRLSAYVAHRNKQWAICWLTGLDHYSYISARGALEAAGVVKAGAEAAEITIKTDTGTQTITLPFLTYEEHMQGERIYKCLYAAEYDLLPYRYLDERNVWCETVGDAVYLQIVNMPDGTTELDQELVKTVNALRDAETPMKLIIDLRLAGTGNDIVDRFQSFAEQVNRQKTNGVYILIGSLTSYHGPSTAYRLKQWIDGAVLVGTSTGQPVNKFGYSRSDDLPNSGLYFYIMERYFCLDEVPADAVLQPDVFVQQTLEDYKNGIDTVFQAALLMTSPEQAMLPEESIAQEEEDPLIQRCRGALDALKYAESYHILVSEDYTDTEFLNGVSEAEYWKVGTNRMARHYPDSDTCTSWLLEWRGKQYKRLDCSTWVLEGLVPYNWTETEFDDVDSHRVLPWFCFLNWDTGEFSVLEHAVVGPTESIILRYSDEEFEWSLYFLLDGEGNLLSVIRNLMFFRGEQCSGSSSVEFLSFDPERVYADMAANAQAPDIMDDQTVYAPTEEERALLLRCYDALFRHQAQTWRHTRVQVSYSGDPGPENDMTAEYWYSPETSLRRIAMADGSRSDGWLVETRNGIYCKGIKPYYPESITSYTMWVEAVNTEPGVMTTWLEEYVWDFDRIRFLGTTQTDEGTVVEFRVLEDVTDNLGGTASYHDVAFCLDGEDHLVYATDDYTLNGTYEGEGYTTHVTAMTRILSYEKDAVTEEMEEILEDIQFSE